MVQLVVPLVGAFLGNAAITGTILGLTGAQLGFLAGSVIGAAVFKPDIPDIGALGGGRISGPKLADRQVQSSSYGQTIPRGYGAFRIAGNVIWAEDLIETEVEQDAGGGQIYTEYLYSANFAVSICEGPIIAVTKIWADGKLIFNVSPGNRGPQADPEVYSDDPELLGSFAANGAGMQTGYSAAGLAIYLGGEEQEPDPTIVEVMGSAPAYRGQAYVVFTGMRLKKFGNRIPNLTFEVLNASGSVEVTNDPYVVGEIVPGTTNLNLFTKGAIDPQTDYFWVPLDNGNIAVMDLFTGEIVRLIEYGVPPGSPSTSLTYRLRLITYNPETRTMWASQFLASGNKCVIFDCDTYEVWRVINTGYTIVNHYDPGGKIMAGVTQYPSQAVQYWYAGSQDNPIRTFLFVYKDVTPSSDYCYGVYSGGNEVLLIVYNLGAGANGVGYVLYDAGAWQPKQWEEGLLNRENGFGNYQTACYDSKRKRWLILGTYDTGNVTERYVPSLYDVSTKTYINCQYPQIADGFYVDYRRLLYHAPTDTFLIALSAIGRNDGIAVYKAEDYTFLRQLDLGDYVPGFLSETKTWNDRYFSTTNSNDILAWPLTGRFISGSDTLASVVTAECARAGLQPSDIDVTLLNDEVLGYYISNQTTIRATLEQLMTAFQFDAVESQGKIKFVPRGGATAAALTIDDLAAHQFGQDVPTPLPLNRADENDLPAVVTVNYSNKTADYQISTQSARRLTTNSISEAAVSLPLVMTDEKAKALADSALYGAWASRTTTTFTTTIAYSELEPTDIVSIEGNSIRIIEKNLEGNIIKFTGAFESNAVYLQGSIAGEPLPSEQGAILLAAKGKLILLDIPLYRDSDEGSNLSFYSAATPYSESNWRGLDAYRSVNGGTTYTKYTSYPTQIVGGYAKNALEPYPDNLVDEYNVLTVVMNSGTLSSITYDELIQGGNVCFLGNEILQFRTATLIGNNTYELTGLLRGRRGSSTGGHKNGDVFVVPSNTTVSRPIWTVAELNQEYFYKGVAPSQSINDAPYVRFTNTGSGAKPYSPVQFAAGRNATGDITFKWVRRTRIGGGWFPEYDVPLGEDTEAYDVVIYSDNTYTTEVRVIAATTETASYTAAQQTTDFGGAQATVYARVYQKSATVGRGFPAQGAL